MSKDTELTVLTDGAKNCWSVISELEKCCSQVITILDWFHIGMKFKHSEHVIPVYYKEDYEKAKWCLWHGNAKKSIMKLKLSSPNWGKIEKNSCADNLH